MPTLAGYPRRFIRKLLSSATVLALYMAAGVRAQGPAQVAIPPVAERRFWLSSSSEPQAVRDWFSDGQSWYEKYLGGRVVRFRPAGYATVDGVHGLLVQEDGDGSQVFIPDCSAPPSVCWLRSRPDAQAPWGWLGEGHFPAAPGTVTRRSAGNAAPFRDDFVGGLRPGWQWIDPKGDSVKTPDASKGGLRVTVTGPHDLYWETGFDAPRLLREADGDFTLETKISGPAAWCGGILVWKDQQNYVRLDRGIHFLNEVSFQASDNGNYARAAAEYLAGDPVWLRLERRGSSFTASYSFDGRDWRSLKRRLLRPVTMYPKIGAREDQMSFGEGASSLEMSAAGPFLVGIWAHGAAPDATEGYLTRTVTDFGYFQMNVP